MTHVQQTSLRGRPPGGFSSQLPQAKNLLLLTIKINQIMFPKLGQTLLVVSDLRLIITTHDRTAFWVYSPTWLSVTALRESRCVVLGHILEGKRTFHVRTEASCVWIKHTHTHTASSALERSLSYCTRVKDGSFLLLLRGRWTLL